MRKLSVLMTGIGLAAVLAGASLADGGHGHGGDRDWQRTGPAAGMGPQGHDMMDMMSMMMRMHGGMMGGRGMAGGGMMGPGQGMMDEDMMGMMSGGGMGFATPDAFRGALDEKFGAYDSDGDGKLTIDEFEAMHSALIREAMVDRFQHLDADGDGNISQSEMRMPAERMGQRGAMPFARPAPGRPGMAPGSGPMMNDDGTMRDD